MVQPADPAIGRIALAYNGTARAIRDRLLHYVRSVWGGLDSYRNADIDRFVSHTVPVVGGAQRQAASLTDAYFATLQAATLGTAMQPMGIPSALLTSEALRGVAANIVYARTGSSVWRALAGGASLADAAGQGLERALSLASTDLQLARTHASRYVIERNDNIVGYRRVPGGGSACALCIVASTQRYHSGDLMPIHPGCYCDTEPIFGDEDPGQIIDPDTLDGVHDAIAERFGSSSADARSAVDYRDALVVHEHGELGPVLAVRGQNFTGPDDI